MMGKKIYAKKRFNELKLSLLVVGLIISGAVLYYAIHASNLPYTTTTPPASGWIISGTAINLLESAGAGQNLINSVFNNSKTYLILGKTMADPLPNALPVQSFTSYADIQAAFKNNNIQPRTKAILYDNEGWSFTPQYEQRDPVHYAQLASTLVHQHGLKFINTPALDLVQAPVGDKYNAFVQAGLLNAAKYTDVFEIQLQGTEMNPNYISFGQDASHRVRSINPNTLLFLGLSTNPSGNTVTAQDVFNAYSGTKAYVDGYWMNVPQGGTYCPNCGTPQTQVAIDFYNRILSQPTVTPNAPTPTNTPAPTKTPTPPTPTPITVGVTGVSPGTIRQTVAYSGGVVVGRSQGSPAEVQVDTSKLSTGTNAITLDITKNDGSVATQTTTVAVHKLSWWHSALNFISQRMIAPLINLFK